MQGGTTILTEGYRLSVEASSFSNDNNIMLRRSLQDKLTTKKISTEVFHLVCGISATNFKEAHEIVQKGQ